MKPKRHRGVQPGNQNARKHGYYATRFNRAEKFDFRQAAGMEGIAEEIALLRYEIKKAVSGGDVRHLVPLVKAAEALERLIRTHHKVFTGETKRLETAIANVYRHVLVPLGVRLVKDGKAYRFCSIASPPALNESNPGTIKPENEADLTYNEKPVNEAD